MAVNARGECVFVADCDNGRIVLLNRSLKCAHELGAPVVGGALNKLRCVHLYEANSRLFVGEKRFSIRHSIRLPRFLTGFVQRW